MSTDGSPKVDVIEVLPKILDTKIDAEVVLPVEKNKPNIFSIFQYKRPERVEDLYIFSERSK
jgi:hypothetical protein